MQKHIYFGPVNSEQAAEFDTYEVKESTFYTGHYDFHMEVNVEDQFVRITDAIGRMLPVDVTEIESMIGALTLAKDLMDSGSFFVVDADGDFESIE